MDLFVSLLLVLNHLDHLFLVDEILVGSHLEFGTGCFVADENTEAVGLQSTDGPFLADRAFDGCTQGTSLSMTVAEDKDFAVPGMT